MIIVEVKVGISAIFSLVKVLVVYIIRAGWIIVNVWPPPLLLLCVDQLRRPAPRGEEEKQDQCELHTMSLCREGRSVACPVVIKQEQEVVDA